MSATPISQAYTISSAAPPREYSAFEARILAAVAATSPGISPEGGTGNGANTASIMMMTYKTPAILALRRGDVSTVRSVIFGLRSCDLNVSRDEFAQWDVPLTAGMEQTAMKLILAEIGGASCWRYIRGPGPQSFTFLCG